MRTSTIALIVAACAIAALRYQAKRSRLAKAPANLRSFFHPNEIWWVRLRIHSGSGSYETRWTGRMVRAAMVFGPKEISGDVLANQMFRLLKQGLCRVTK